MDAENLLTPEQLAAFLQVKESALVRWRRPEVADGPPFLRVGRAIRYRKADVERWLIERSERVA